MNKFVSALVLEAFFASAVASNKKILETSSTTNSTLLTEQFDINKYFEYVNSTSEGIENISETLKTQLLSYTQSPKIIELSTNLITYFTDNEIVLPDMSASDEGTVIFEFSDVCEHYAIEVFESGLISYFTNKNGKDEFHNFRNLEPLKAKLLEDFGIQQVQ